ncbi:hypothetical protein [Coleofasciculus sp. FACHB-SPT9]|uniref:hypothetical protein n=1 Tax=Cyanophyceae TaxID=3028117 RepID=UPI00168998CC|nr:hypothetical protein [Coleofasciculus sp. FACHB-SPT9]MBD1887966.1 hypothetical protein [Coleofasciculus sp. FACHB-SPT9]
MAISITPGTGGTIKQTNFEAHLLEIITFAKNQELIPARNPQKFNYIQGFTFTDTLFRCNFSLPVNRETNETGGNLITVPDYLTGVTFTPGTGGTFKSANFAAYLSEVILYGQDLEADALKNPTAADRITGSYDINPKVFGGSIEIPIIPSVSTDGRPIYTAVPYLV